MTDWSQFTPVDQPKVDWSKFTPVAQPSSAPIGDMPPDFGQAKVQPGETDRGFATIGHEAGRNWLDAMTTEGSMVAGLNATPAAQLVGAAKGLPSLVTGDLGGFTDAVRSTENEVSAPLHQAQTPTGHFIENAANLPTTAGKFVGDTAQDAGAWPSIAAGLDVATQFAPFALMGGEEAPRIAPRDPVTAAVAPTADALAASEHVTAGQPAPQAAEAAQGTASLMDAVRQADAQVESSPVPNPVTPAAPPVQEGRATPIAPPPEVAAKLKEVTGGDPAKMASIIEQATGGNLKPGETPGNLAKAAQEATNEPAGPVPVGSENGGNGIAVDRAPDAQPPPTPVETRAAAPAVEAAPPDGAVGVEPQRVVSVNGADVKLTPEQSTKWDAAQADYESKVEFAKRNYQSADMRDKALKQYGMELSAQRRQITDQLTPKERAVAATAAAKLRPGDTVTVDGKAGKIASNAYGRVQVLFDGESAPRTVDRAGISKQPVAQPAPESTAIAAPSTASSELAVKPVEQNVPQLDPARMNELRQARDAGTITPEQHAELNQHLETALSTAEVGGEHVPGLLNQVGRAQLETSGKMKPFRAKTDIDDFKEVNDTLGHDVGDEVLKAKAQAMVDAFGPGNAWREGGDEFGAHADTPEELHAGMAKVKQAMKDLVVEGVDQQGKPVAELPMGVSYGVGKGDTPKLAAKAADNALYVDKATRTATGERRGRRATDAQEIGQGVGAGSEGQGRGDVPGSEQAQVAVAERTAEPPTRAAEEPAKPVPEGQTEVSARNAAVDADRLARDLPELPEAEREEWATPYAEARAKIDANKSYPKELAAEVVKSKRPISATETMALTHDLRELTQEHADATRGVLEARDAGDHIGEVQARARLQAAQDALTLNHQAIRVGGTEAARALSIRNAIVKKDYSIGRNMDRAQVSYGDKFDSETKKVVEHFTDEIKKADESYEKAVADAENKASAGRKKSPDEIEQDRLQKKMADLNAKIEARLKACPI